MGHFPAYSSFRFGSPAEVMAGSENEKLSFTSSLLLLVASKAEEVAMLIFAAVQEWILQCAVGSPLSSESDLGG